MGNQSSARHDSTSNASSQAQATMQKMMRHCPGVSYAVASSRSTVYRGSVGVLDAVAPLPHHSNVTTNTMFMAYSSATYFILTIHYRNIFLSTHLILQLPSDHYLKSRGSDITIRMLLDHTSGVPNPLPLDWFFVEEAVDSSSMNDRRQESFYKVLQQASTLKFTPGGGHLYSNVCYWILEHVIQKVTGKSYDDVFLEEIVHPLERKNCNDACSHLTFDIPPSSVCSHEQQEKSVLARGHSPRFHLQTFVFYLLTPKKYWSALNNYHWSGFRRLVPHGMGYGGMYSSVEGLMMILVDLLKGMEENGTVDQHSEGKDDSGVLLSLESKREMFGLGNSNPLGWAAGTVLVEDEQQPYLTKPGGGLGYHGNIRVYTRLGLATAFMCNGTCVSADAINKRSDCLDLPFLKEGLHHQRGVDNSLESVKGCHSMP